VLDGVAFHHDAAGVQLACRLQRPIRGGEHVIERRRLPLRSHLGIRMTLVVDELIFVTDGGIQVFEHEVLHAAVAGLRNPPLPRQLELLVGARRNDVARASRILAVVGRKRQESVLDLPPRAGGVRFLVAAPAVEALAVEQQLPPVTLLLGRELIVRRRRGRLPRERRAETDPRSKQRCQPQHPAKDSRHQVLPQDPKRTSDNTIPTAK